MSPIVTSPTVRDASSARSGNPAGRVHRWSYAKCALRADVGGAPPPDHRASRFRMEQEMQLGTVIAASTPSWPEAAIAIAGIALVGSVAVVVVWQALSTWRTRIAVTREEAYRTLAEETARELHEIRKHVLDMAIAMGAADRKEQER
jgi:hypothetical protein